MVFGKVGVVLVALNDRRTTRHVALHPTMHDLLLPSCSRNRLIDRFGLVGFSNLVVIFGRVVFGKVRIVPVALNDRRTTKYMALHLLLPGCPEERFIGLNVFGFSRLFVLAPFSGTPTFPALGVAVVVVGGNIF